MRKLMFRLLKLGVKLLQRNKRVRKWVVKFSLAGNAYNFLYQHLKPKSITLMEVQGNKMYLDPSDIVCSLLLVNVVWERCETVLFKGLVKRGMVVADIGAHVGYYSLLAAMRVGEDGKVFAFEPHPDNYSLLLKNIEVNGYKNAIPIQKAVSNKSGTVQLHLHPENKGGSRICDFPLSRQHILVSAITLDDFFKDKDYQIDLIRMDIEGAEMWAVEGMDKIISENKNLTIIAEFFPRALRTFGVSPKHYVNKLVEHGFQLYEIDEEQEAIKPIDAASITKNVDSESRLHNFTNLLCKRGIRW